MVKIKPQTLKGFRDFLPDQMVIRQKVIETLKEVFESYGFEPLETPSLEYAETLLGKSGKEAEKLFYLFQDPGRRQVGLIYELTVSAARVLAQYPNLAKPFKRYQIQRVWRAEKPQKGRYREILQCDVDIFGSSSPLADAEIIAITYNSLKGLNFKKFTIRINSRQVLFELMEKADVPKNKTLETIRIIDKLDKIGKEKVEKEISRSLNNQTAKKIFTLINQSAPDPYLNQVLKTLQSIKVPEKFWQFDPTLARGLDYYTGPVFETYVDLPAGKTGKPKIGSITGGGRYDNLVAQLGGPDIPATGTTIGLDRICDVIKVQNLWPEVSPTPVSILVTIFSPKLALQSIKVATLIRKRGINCELYLDPETKLDRQLKYANQKGIPFVVIIGPEEVEKKMITLRNMRKKTQKQILLDQLPKELNS